LGFAFLIAFFTIFFTFVFLGGGVGFGMKSQFTVVDALFDVKFMLSRSKKDRPRGFSETINFSIGGMLCFFLERRVVKRGRRCEKLI
jgi:hypothetical protein